MRTEMRYYHSYKCFLIRGQIIRIETNNKQTIIIALLAIFLGTITASADIVKGRVVDSETKEPLPEAQIQYVQTYDNGRSFMNMTADSLGCFNFHTSGRGNIEVSMLGYYNKTKPVLAVSGQG